MSKSLGNIFTVRDVLDNGYRASALRYLLLSVPYRKQLTFGWDGRDQAEAALTRLGDFLARVSTVVGGDAHEEIATRVGAARDQFRTLIASDLNVPGALGVVFDLVREMNAAMDEGRVGAADAAVIRAAFDEFDRVLGVLALRRAEEAVPPVPVAEIDALVEARREARRARQFQRADEIRRDLEARGILLEDTAAGTRWKRK
jgi:cysteinyl-tRNA synthetase